jgi:hypothetical protein
LFQSAAYGAPEALQAKGDKIAAVIFVNEVDGGRFRESDQIGGGQGRPICPGHMNRCIVLYNSDASIVSSCRKMRLSD